MVDSLDVVAELAGRSVLVGRAYFYPKGATVTSTFSYDPTWLERPDTFPIDPHLPLVSGNQYVEGLPGAFQDAAPDRWGRNLIAKRHQQTARAAGRTPPMLTDVDYLIGVSDITRQGALRFAHREQFLAEGSDVPKLVELPELLDAATAVDQRDEAAAIKMLLDAGTASLGGARPKASVRQQSGALAIAKFPRTTDDWDVERWEAIALALARDAGIAVPSHRRELIDGRTVLVLDRFDRGESGSRIPYVSMMTAAGRSDGDAGDYADIAAAIGDSGGNVDADLRELFTRAIFNVAVNNTDDHLRNHGLFRPTSRGWVLSPAF